MSEELTFRGYQAWFDEYDRLRDWERILPAHQVVHLAEEVGEIARLVLRLDGYRDLPPEARARTIDELALEINDAIVFLTKIANTYGIDLDETMRRGQAKAEARYSPEQGRRDKARYLDRQREMLAWLEGDDEFSAP